MNSVHEHIGLTISLKSKCFGYVLYCYFDCIFKLVNLLNLTLF